MKQWTGVEQKAIVKQIIPVLTPLLIQDHSAALDFTCALVDFILIAQYQSYNDKTPGYLEQTLYWIDLFKECFRLIRPINKETGESQFNIPKLHAIVHYSGFICQYDPVNGYNTAYIKAFHKIMIKVYYYRTNKRDDFQFQLM